MIRDIIKDLEKPSYFCYETKVDDIIINSFNWKILAEIEISDFQNNLEDLKDIIKSDLDYNSIILERYKYNIGKPLTKRNYILLNKESMHLVDEIEKFEHFYRWSISN
jgi:hypothetical protein